MSLNAKHEHYMNTNMIQHGKLKCDHRLAGMCLYKCIHIHLH